MKIKIINKWHGFYYLDEFESIEKRQILILPVGLKQKLLHKWKIPIQKQFETVGIRLFKLSDPDSDLTEILVAEDPDPEPDTSICSVEYRHL
jgi:hypothetical protein